jgi:hypothetical protein
VKQQRSVLLCRPHHLGIDPDPTVPDRYGIALQRRTRPSRGNIAIVKIERGKVAWAKQATVDDTAQAQIGLFMRTSPVARKNPVAIADQQQIDVLQPEAEDVLMRQPIQRTDRNPSIVL